MDPHTANGHEPAGVPGWSASRIHTGPVRRFAVSILKQPGNIHSECFREVVETMHHQLVALGHDCQVTDAVDGPDRTNIIFGANSLANMDEKVEFRPGSILFNLEQIYEGSPWLTPVVMEAFRRHVVWDYSLANIAELAKMGVTAHHVPITYAPALTRITPSPAPDIDVLFIGSHAPRRLEVLKALNEGGARVMMINGAYGSERDALIARAKIHLNIHFHATRVFEIVRVSYLLANRGFVISEVGSEVREEDSFAGGVVFVPYEQLVDTCLRYLKDPAARATIAARGFELMSGRTSEAELRAAIAGSDDPRR